jgi:hypothetical protein
LVKCQTLSLVSSLKIINIAGIIFAPSSEFVGQYFFNQLTQLIAQEEFAIISHHEGYISYCLSCDLNIQSLTVFWQMLNL